MVVEQRAPALTKWDLASSQRLIDAFVNQWGDLREWPIAAKRIAFLSCRVDDGSGQEEWMVLLLGRRIARATYFIDTFCEMEWLLRGLLHTPPLPLADDTGYQVWTQSQRQLTEQLRSLLEFIEPIADTCRYIYAACTFSATARSKYLRRSTPVLSMDHETQYYRYAAKWCSRDHESLFLQNCGYAGKWHFMDCDERCFRDRESRFRDHFMSQQNISLQVFLKSEQKRGWSTLTGVNLMLAIASTMRSLEEFNSALGQLSPQTMFLDCYWFYNFHVKLHPTIATKPGNFYIAPEIAKHISSDVYSYGSVCFNILTADVPGALESTQSIGSQSESNKYVRRGRWKQLVKGKPEYLVRLIASCWETDPRKRPTFATICSLLHRALRCLIFPPVLNLTRLSNFLQQSKYNLLNLYLSFTWSRDVHCRVMIGGTEIMNELLEAFANDTIMLQHFSSDFMCNKAMQAFVQIKALVSKDAKSTLMSQLSKMFKASLWQLFGASSQKLEIKERSSEDMCESIPALSQIIYEEEEGVDCKSSLTPSSAGELHLRSLFRKEFDSSSDTAFKSDLFEQHSIIFEALVYDSMVATFPSLDYQFWIRPLINKSHLIPRPRLLTPTDNFVMNHSLIPWLACFWESSQRP